METEHFDSDLFIDEIQKRPAIWDMECPDYKNKVIKKRNWEELVEIFCDAGDSLEKKKLLATIESLHVPTGGGVELPCDVAPALPDDRMGLVIWYKQGHETPIYTLDTREGVTSHWSDTTLGVRATFRSDTRPAVLIITKLRPEDSGQYSCRVDFIKSPTKNTRLNLTVLTEI